MSGLNAQQALLEAGGLWGARAEANLSSLTVL